MEVYSHTATSPVLQRALRSALPYSINLAYRTQHSNRTKDAHILATFPESAEAAPRCWAAAYLDRAMRPETELWIFAAGEDPDHDVVSNAGSESKKSFCRSCREAVLLLLDHMSTLPTPPLHPSKLPALELAKEHQAAFPDPPGPAGYAPSPGSYTRHLLLPQVVTLGACHHAVVQICQEVGIIRYEFPGLEAELNKFLFKIADLPETKELPAGLKWGEVREQDMDLVKSRTIIPRSTRTLLSMKCIGVFEEKTDTLVAWTFLGLDGSLTALYTEEAWRGKGIAKAMVVKIFQQYAPGIAVDDNGDAWSHADVYMGNIQSESVCKSLSGKAMWTCFWVRTDLEPAGTLTRSG